MKPSSIMLLTLIWINLNYCTTSSEGKRIYQANCANCHMDDGNGLAQLIPELNEKNIIAKRNNIACFIIQGIKVDSTMVMPAYKKMEPTQIANVLNYILYLKKSNTRIFNTDEITRALDNCK